MAPAELDLAEVRWHAVGGSGRLRGGVLAEHQQHTAIDATRSIWHPAPGGDPSGEVEQDAALVHTRKAAKPTVPAALAHGTAGPREPAHRLRTL